VSSSSALLISVCGWVSVEELPDLRFELAGAVLEPPPPVDTLSGFFGDIEPRTGGVATDAQHCTWAFSQNGCGNTRYTPCVYIQCVYTRKTAEEPYACNKSHI
jgi:hypothetical protein